MSAAGPELERLIALLADRALQGLASHEAQELAGLRRDFPDLDEDVLESVAARIEVALAPAPANPLRAAVRRALRADAEAAFALPAPEPPAPEPASAEPEPAPAPAWPRAPAPRPWLWAWGGFAAGVGLTLAALGVARIVASAPGP